MNQPKIPSLPYSDYQRKITFEILQTDGVYQYCSDTQAIYIYVTPPKTGSTEIVGYYIYYYLQTKTWIVSITKRVLGDRGRVDTLSTVYHETAFQSLPSFVQHLICFTFQQIEKQIEIENKRDRVKTDLDKMFSQDIAIALTSNDPLIRELGKRIAKQQDDDDW
jgi:hypothetical protein